jgi:hypothetical protein
MDNMPYWWILDHATTLLAVNGYDEQHDLLTTQERQELKPRNEINHYMFQALVQTHKCATTTVTYRSHYVMSMAIQWSVRSQLQLSTTHHYQHYWDSTH